ncbi:hypothetical protein CRENBAI_001697 [Crenichthys baileyi]|uniref:Uncharacterized protein n=1 Tax=Crenichthys baileyi TaxID=28760 RepID=A0AAV9SCE2_9TELE
MGRPCLKCCSGFWSPSLLVFAQLSFKTPARRPAASLRSGSDLHSPAAQGCAEDLHTCLSTLQPHYLDREEDFSLDGHSQAAALAHLPTVGPSSVVKTRPLPGVPVTAPVSPTQASQTNHPIRTPITFSSCPLVKIQISPLILPGLKPAVCDLQQTV